MKVLVDMNLSPEWTEVLAAAGIDALHWAQVGKPNEKDREIMRWARENGFVILTHDLDFGTALALTRSNGPSVIQIRSQDVAPAVIGRLTVENLQRFRRELENGALLVIDHVRSRIRILPLFTP